MTVGHSNPPSESSDDDDSRSDEKPKCRFPEINVEPSFVLFALFVGLYSSVSSVFNYYKICMLYNEAMPNSAAYCRNPQQTNNSVSDATTKLIQTEVSYLDEYMSYCNTIPALISSFLIGTWSDRYGRKPFLAMPIAGCMIYPVILIYSATFIYSPTWILLVGRFLDGCFANGIFLVASSSVRDQFPSSKILAIRLTVLNSSFSCGMLCGSLAGSFLMKILDYPHIVVISLVPLTLAFLYIVFIVKETFIPVHHSVGPIPTFAESQKGHGSINYCTEDIPIKRNSVFSDCCNWLGVTSLWQTITKRRPHNHRRHLFLGLFAFTLFLIALGSFNVFLLYVKLKPFSWSNSLYVQQGTFSNAISFIGVPLLVMFLKKILKAHDLVIVLVGLSSCVSRQIVLSISRKTWQIFAASGAGIAEYGAFAGFRSFLVQLVDKDETAKLFSLIAAVELIGPLIATAIFNNLYPLTISFFPGLMFDVGAAVTFIALAIVFFVYIRERKPSTKEEESVLIVSEP